MKEEDGAGDGQAAAGAPGGQGPCCTVPGDVNRQIRYLLTVHYWFSVPDLHIRTLQCIFALFLERAYRFFG